MKIMLRVPKSWQQWRSAHQDSAWQTRQMAIAAVVWVFLTAIFSITLLAQRIDVTVGDYAPRSVVAPYGVVDWGATQKARQQAAAAIPEVYTPNTEIAAGSLPTRLGSRYPLYPGAPVGQPGPIR